jgi:hypothetical protein
VEKATVNMAKFGSTSRSDGSSAVVSGVIVQETVAVLPRQPHEEPSYLAQAQESPREVVEEVVAVIENKQVIEGGQIPFGYAGTAQPSPLRPVEERGSAGIPNFSEKVAVKNRPKIEIIGDQCESCSA